MYCGQSCDLARRRAEHARDPIKGKFRFKEESNVDDYATRRGLELQQYDRYGRPILNKNKPIGDTNLNKTKYLDAANKFKSPQSGGKGSGTGGSGGTTSTGGGFWGRLWSALGF